MPSMRNLALLAEQNGDAPSALVLWRRMKHNTSPLDAKFVQKVDAKIAALKARVEKVEPPAKDANAAAPKG